MKKNMIIIEPGKVSIFKNCVSTTPENSFGFDEFIGDIISETYSELVDEYRGLLEDNPPEAAKFKRTKMPAITYAGEFSKRQNDCITFPSKVIILDIDDINDGAKINEIKQAVSADSHTMAVWVSPSDTGLKVAVKMLFGCSPETYKSRYIQVLGYYSKKYQIPIKDSKSDGWGLDSSCSDLSRLCIVSSDKELYYNPDSEIFELFTDFSKTERKVRSLIAKITETQIDITATYQDWVNIGFALIHEFGEAGRMYFHEVSQFHPEYEPNKCDDKYSSFPPTKEGGITIGTFFELVKRAGVSGPYIEEPPDTVPDAAPVPEFPAKVFNADIKRFIEETTESINCPLDYVGVAVMSVISGAMGKKFKLVWKKGYEHTANFYFTIIGDPGQKKSPAIEAACRPLFTIQALYRIEYEALMTQYKIDLQNYKEDKKNKIDSAPPVKTIEKRILASDLTLEALAVLLHDNPKGVLLIYDELLLWFNSFNQYKAKGNDLQKWLSIWSRANIIIDRKGEESNIIESPFLTLIGGIQPDVLNQFSKRQNDGFLDRILFVYPEYKLANYSDHEIGEVTYNQYEQMISDMVNKGSIEFLSNGNIPTSITPSGEAYSKWVEWIKKHHSETEGDGFPYYLKGVWSKMEAHSLRFALLLFFNRMPKKADNKIEPADIDGAIKLSEYFKGHIRRAYDIIHSSDYEKKITALVAYLKKVGGNDSVRNIIRKGIGGLRRVAEVIDLFVEMEGRGLGKKIEKTNKGGKPTISFQLNTN